LDVTQDGLDKTAAALANERFHPVLCDIRSAEAVQSTMAEIGNLTGKINALIASAGVNRLGALSEMSVEDFDLVFDVNVRGLWLSARETIPFLRAAAKDGENSAGRSASRGATPGAETRDGSRGREGSPSLRNEGSVQSLLSRLGSGDGSLFEGNSVREPGVQDADSSTVIKNGITTAEAWERALRERKAALAKALDEMDVPRIAEALDGILSRPPLEGILSQPRSRGDFHDPVIEDARKCLVCWQVPYRQDARLLSTARKQLRTFVRAWRWGPNDPLFLAAKGRIDAYDAVGEALTARNLEVLTSALEHLPPIGGNPEFKEARAAVREWTKILHEIREALEVHNAGKQVEQIEAELAKLSFTTSDPVVKEGFEILADHANRVEHARLVLKDRDASAFAEVTLNGLESAVLGPLVAEVRAIEAEHAERVADAKAAINACDMARLRRVGVAGFQCPELAQLADAAAVILEEHDQVLKAAQAAVGLEDPSKPDRRRGDLSIAAVRAIISVADGQLAQSRVRRIEREEGNIHKVKPQPTRASLTTEQLAKVENIQGWVSPELDALFAEARELVADHDRKCLLAEEAAETRDVVKLEKVDNTGWDTLSPLGEHVDSAKKLLAEHADLCSRYNTAIASKAVKSLYSMAGETWISDELANLRVKAQQIIFVYEKAKRSIEHQNAATSFAMTLERKAVREAIDALEPFANPDGKALRARGAETFLAAALLQLKKLDSLDRSLGTPSDQKDAQFALLVLDPQGTNPTYAEARSWATNLELEFLVKEGSGN
jgi:NAD(P)-dependent dehydrogenase (short-subunit alcohol dehydrogenase family)